MNEEMNAQENDGQQIGNPQRTDVEQVGIPPAEKEDPRQEALMLCQQSYLQYVQLKSVPFGHPDHAAYEAKEEELSNTIKEAQKRFKFTDEEIQAKGKEYIEIETNKKIVASLRRVLEINKLISELSIKHHYFRMREVFESRDGADKSLWEAYVQKDDLNKERRDLVHFLGKNLFNNRDNHKTMSFIQDHGERMIDELSTDESPLE